MHPIKYWRWGCVGFSILIVGIEAIIVAVPNLIEWQTANWLAAHLVDHSRIVAEMPDEEIKNVAQNNLFSPYIVGPGAATWNWRFVPSVEAESPLSWLATGAHYLVVDDRTLLGGDFSKRLRNLVDHGATLLYVSPTLLNIGPRQAILWTFRPDHPLNLILDGKLLLIGYNVSHNSGGQISVLLHWYTLQSPPVAYHLFTHAVDPVRGEVGIQPDVDLGGPTHPTNRWNKGEIVFESLDISQEAVATLYKPYHLRLGLYQVDNGVRANVADESQRQLGDHFDIDLP